MTSDRLVEFVEGKLTEHGITKVIPAKETLAKAFRLFARAKLVEAVVEKASKRGRKSRAPCRTISIRG
jgi:hypothetical protein